MALKTFNLDKETYEAYSKHCKKQGISMSKQIQNFIARELEKIQSKQPRAKAVKQVTQAVTQTKGHSFQKYC